jgi:hypothetical protein
MLRFMKRWSHSRDWSAPRRRKSPHPSIHGFEALEERLCLAAASITMFNASPTNNGQEVKLSGYVADEHPGSVQLSFSGAASGSTTANSEGYFELYTQASGLGTVQAVATDNEQLESTASTAAILSLAPVISGLTVSETGNGRMVNVSGTVMDEAPAGRTVTLGGVVSGTTNTDSNGHFSVTLEASSLGMVTAVTSDAWGQESAVAQATLFSAAPVITNLTIVESGPDRTVTVSGMVSDLSPSGRTVTLSGVVSGMVMSGSNGYFSATLQASQLGTMFAQTTDVWGQTSTLAQATLMSGVPTITLTVTESLPNWFVFSGTVADMFPGGLTVSFGGLLAGQTTTTYSNGLYLFSASFPVGTFGIATATVTDIWGQVSFQAQVMVSNWF